MKSPQVIKAQGIYVDAGGDWQQAFVASDGHDLSEVDPRECAKRAACSPSELTGFAAEDAKQLPDADALLSACMGEVMTGFDQADRAMGGRGAPLEPFYLHALAWFHQEQAPIAYLELSDVARMTWVDPRVERPDDPRAIISFETGPALGTLHLLNPSRAQTKQTGTVAEGALELFLDDSYFRRMPPKWMDRGRFAELTSLVMELPIPDAEATLCAMTATSVVLALEHLPEMPTKIVLLGKGAQHDMMVRMIGAGVGVPILPCCDWGLYEATLQAQVLAYLAIRNRYGLTTTSPSTTGVAAAVGGAQLLQR